jgi:hypothetical protein
MKKKEKKEMIERAKTEIELEEEGKQMSEERMDYDYEQRKMYPSEEVIPTDVFLYKKLRIIPEAQTDFQGLIDKDVVLSNLGGKLPSGEYLKFVVETIDVFKRIFVIEKEVIVKDNEGNPLALIDNQTSEKTIVVRVEKIFDKEFEPVSSMLTAGYKFDLCRSRAMGREREAILDRTTSISKEIGKKKDGEKTMWRA